MSAKGCVQPNGPTCSKLDNIFDSFVFESVRWLMEKGEAEKSVTILRKIARVNGKDVNEGVYDDFRALVNKQCEESKGSAAPGFLQALRNRLR